MTRPKPLQKGDKVALVSTARKISMEELKPAMALLRSWELEPVCGNTLFAAENQFAGSDTQRISGIQEMLDNPEIAAILCVRGGYGTTRIIDEIDFSIFSSNPKWVAGFSDVTALLCHISNLKIESVHSSMPVLFDERTDHESKESLRRLLFGEEVSYSTDCHVFQRQGKAKGKLIGGNLSVLCTIIGTPSFPDLYGAILFIEDLDEYLYHIDRMMVQLKRSGAFANLSGVIVGHMSAMRDNTIPFGHTAYEIIRDNLQDYDFPVAYGFPIGHEVSNHALAVGRDAELSISNEGVILKYC